MSNKLLILLLMCALSTVKKVYSQENNYNITLFTKHYSSNNFEKAAEIGTNILSSEESRPKDDERFRLLYKTIRSYAYAGKMPDAYNLLKHIEVNQNDWLFSRYIQLYQAIIAIDIDKNTEAKTILEVLLKEDNTTFLHDSVKAKIYHNMAVISYKENNRAQQLQYLRQSFELEKKTLISNANYENYNLSVEVYAGNLFSKYRQYEEAYKVFQEAIALPFNKTIGLHNHALYQNYIGLLLGMGMENKAQPYINQLTKFYQNKEEYLLKEYISHLNTLANHYWMQNNYTKSILYASNALSICSNKEQLKELKDVAYYNLIRCYFDLQEYEKMRSYLLKNIGECKTTNQESLAYAYLNTGINLAKIYNDEIAYSYIDSASHLYYNKLKLPKDRTFENIIARAYYELGQYSQCLFHLENANKVMVLNGNYESYFFWDNKYERALCYHQLSFFSKAYDLLKVVNIEMLKKYPHLLDKSSTIQNSRFGLLYRNVNIALAENLYNQYLKNKDLSLLEKAFSYISEAEQGIKLLRSKQNYDRDRLVAGELYYNFTEQSTKVSMALYEATGKNEYLQKAFDFVQKGKAYALMQGINEKRYKLNSGVPLKMINELNAFKKQYDRYEKHYNEAYFSSTTDSSLIASLNNQMSQSMANIDSLNDLIKKQFPEYHQEEARAPFLSIEQIQDRLGKHQVIVDFYQTNSEIFRFAINKDTVLCDVIVTETDFKQCFKLVTKEVSTPFIGQHTKEHTQKFAAAAYSLYNHLLKDLEPLIGDSELIIVPHGELSYLPFEILLTEDVSMQKPKFSAYPWLIKKQTVSYSYNTAMLHNKSAEAIPFSKILAFAPKYKGNVSTDSIRLDETIALDSVLMPLQGAKEEIKAIEALFSTKSYTGGEANRANFIESMQDNYILHLAMHSLNDEVQPFNSQLVFASDDSLSGSFTAGEIYNYSIKSPLVVLSSCSTGRGQKQRGEGLLSIARAFTYAGVEAQVMTLWPVNDRSGASIVEDFYTQLDNGLDKNKALQASKLNYLSSADGVKSHPYYWANYVLAGNTNPVKQQMPKGLFIYLLAFAMLSVIIFFYVDRKKS